VSKGSSIKLFQPVDMLGIAEGIESAMSAHIETGYPVWSCCNANHLMHVEIPKSVTDVVIFEDSDKSFTGQMASSTLAHRLTVREGKRVRIVKLIDTGKGLEQYCEQGLDADFNDYILSQTIRDRKTA
jgi:putative DNA primase/helicase